MLSRLRCARISTRFAVLRPTPGSVSSSSIVVGHVTAEPRQDLLARLLHVHGLVPIEADRVDQLLDLLHRQPRHRPRRSRDAKQPRRRRVRHRVLRPRRQQRRDQHLKGILLLIRRRSSRRPAPRGRRSPARAGASRCDTPTRNDRLRAQLHTGVSGGCPESTAITFRTARSAIAVRVSRVALPRCGTSTTFSSGEPGMDLRLSRRRRARRRRSGARSAPRPAPPRRRPRRARC